MSISSRLELQEHGSRGYVYVVSAIAAVGGLLFGFDLAIVSGAIGPVVKEFNLGEWQKGFAVGCVTVGCIFGAGLSGYLSDWLGRKRILIVTALFYSVSAILAGLPLAFTQLMVARFIGGLAVGVSSMISPVYIAEIAPAKIRGRLVSMQQMAIVTGIVLAYFVSWLLLGIYNDWRWMFASQAVPATVLLFALFFVPESPRWLTQQGKRDRALKILSRVGGAAHARSELKEIEESLTEEQGSIFELLKPGLRIALLIGIALAVLQQFSGINNLILYGPEIFKSAGYSEDSASLMAQVILGTTNCVCTILAMWIIDKVGRRPLLIVGAAGMALTLSGAIFALPSPTTAPAIKLAFFVAYVAFFAVGLGPTVWVVMAEIFPTKVRGRAMSIATLSLWVGCYTVAQTFPVLRNHLGTNVFWIYVGMCVLMIIFVLAVVPETKGKTLEEIEKMWRHGGRRLESQVESVPQAFPVTRDVEV